MKSGLTNMIGWNIVLTKKLPSVFIVFSLSNLELETLGLRHIQKTVLKIGRMPLHLLILMWVMSEVLIIKARRDCRAFQNPRQNVQQVWAGSDKKKEEEYLGRLTIMLSVVRFLLLQALAFRGHDESAISKNRGNFLEMVH